MVKPPWGALGHGVRFCDGPDDSAAALTALRGTTSAFGDRITEVVAQEYLVGAEYVVNTVSCEGVHTVTDVWSTDRVSANGVRDLVVAQVLLRHEDPVVDDLVRYGFQVLDALGVRFGAAHLEIKLTPDGPRLVEAGARPSGLPYHVAMPSVRASWSGRWTRACGRGASWPGPVCRTGVASRPPGRRWCRRWRAGWWGTAPWTRCGAWRVCVR
ncbi:hypothetical protein ABZ619_23890 [Streptomyces sp. NPDC007851]|uniref:hypothetical protein n=1 Tax=Streptomyces sp. NPDC007851 TaxID=3155008 RepID=UPI0033C17BF7